MCSTAAISADTVKPRKEWLISLPTSAENIVLTTPGETLDKSSDLKSAAIGDVNAPDIPIINSTETIQFENSIAIDPNNPQIILSANNSKSWPGAQGLGVSGFISTDGGSNWSTDFSGLPYSNEHPAAGIDPNGRLLAGYLVGGQAIGNSYSDDLGANWNYVEVRSYSGLMGYSVNKNHLCVDNNPNSPYYGNVYSAWTLIIPPMLDPHFRSGVELMCSQDDGVTWGTGSGHVWTGAFGELNQGVNIQTGPDGEIYVVWSVYYFWGHNYSTGGTNENAIAFRKSLDGGQTWSDVTLAIANIKGHRVTPLGGGKTMRHNSFPSMTVDQNTGRVYVVWTNQGTPGINFGDPDIYMIFSDNGGDNWSTPVRINQDQIGNGKDQYFPWISCDPITGKLACVFYDSRSFPSNDMVETFVSISHDNGATWLDFCVSDVAWSGDAIPGLYYDYAGDYIGISVYAGRALPVWSDDRTGNMLAYMSPFCFTYDSDGDGISNDGDCSGSSGDNFCTGGNTVDCDDNCTDIYNPNQEDGDSDGIGDVCDQSIGTIYVPGDYPTIQAAIDATSSGATIIVAPGIYDTPGNYNINFGGKNLTVASSGGPDVTIIDCGGVNNKNRGFEFVSGEIGQSVVSGFTIRDGDVRNRTAGPYMEDDKNGGGIKIVGSHPRIEYCIFENCQARVGGAIHMMKNDAGTGSVPTIIGCTFKNNSSQYGGGSVLVAGGCHLTFSRNIVANTLNGGGLSSSANTTIIFSCNDFWANSGGDIVGNYGPGDVDPGTIFMNPLFCDGLHLREGSRCLPDHPENSCAVLIGALNVGDNGCEYMCGDINSDGIFVDISDQVYLVDYMFTGGPPPFPIEAGDVDCNGQIDISDLLIVVDFLFNSGPYPCDCTPGSPRITDEDASLPERFALKQNHPNPFNPSTTISFNLPVEDRVRLEIYNIAGQKVKILLDETRQAGSHSIVWDGRDESGNPAASGIYFYRLETTDFTESKKMVLLK
jgi:hypothetical protein